MSDLTELLERVEKATGPDREIDAMIAADIAGLCLHGSWHSEGPEGDRGRVCDDCGADSWGNLGKHGQRLNDPVPAYTTSIDAALALVERVLPGASVCLVSSDAGWLFDLPFHRVETEAPTAQRATLAALLRALIAQQAKP